MTDDSISLQPLGPLLASALADVMGDLPAVLRTWIQQVADSATSDSALLNRIYATRFSSDVSAGGVQVQASVAVFDELALGWDGLPLDLLIGSSDGDGVDFDFRFQLNLADPSGIQFALLLERIALGLRIDSHLLVPVDNQRAPTGEPLLVNLGEVAIGLDQSLNVTIVTSQNVSIPECMIGDTGIIIAAQGIALSMSEGQLRLGEVTIRLPPDLPVPELTMKNASLGAHGFSGEVGAAWDLSLSQSRNEFVGNAVGKLFDVLPCGMRRAVIRFDRNLPVAFEIEGQVLVPELDNGPMEVVIGLAPRGELQVDLNGRDGGLLKLTRDQLFELQVNAAELRHTAEETRLTVAGDLQLTNPTVSNIVPKLALKGFTVYKPVDGRWAFRIEGGAVTINKSIDLFNVARADIRQIGMGKRDGTTTLTFSGGVQIFDGIDAAGWVEGLRVPLESGGGLELDGIGLEAVVPDTFAFAGAVARKREGGNEFFQGEIGLYLFPVELEFGAALKVGKNPLCRYGFISAYLNLPGPGIPLASLPLYVRGFKGLLGVNVTPDAKGIFDYFPLAARAPVGLEDPAKWRDECGSHAVGLGVTVATANPKLLNLSALLAFVHPELLLLIEGNAFVLETPRPGKQPPFRAVMAFDIDEPAALLNVGAEREFVKGVLTVNGMVEAYYGPDPSALSRTTSYIALGKVRPFFPANQLVRGKVLQLFDANTYFIIVPGRSALGLGIGLPKKRVSLSFASIEFNAWMQGAGMVAWAPVQLDGSMSLKGRVGFRVLRKGFDLSLGASVIGKTPDWLVSALLEFGVRFKILWKKFEFKGTIPFRWERRVIPPVPELLKDIRLQHAVSSRTWSPHIVAEDPGTVPAGVVPEVEPDAFPAIEFAFPTKDRTGLPFGQDVSVVPNRHSGDDEFEALLPDETALELYRAPLGSGNWEAFARPPEDLPLDPTIHTTPMLFGAWQADESPDGTTGATHLHLFTRTPFDFNRPVRLNIVRAAELIEHKLVALGSGSPIAAIPAGTPASEVVNGLAASVIAMRGDQVVREVTINGEARIIPATSTADIPVYETRPRPAETLTATGQPLPYRAAQYVVNEHPGYPHSGATPQPDGPVTPTFPAQARCHNFLRTAPGFHAYAHVIALDEEDPTRFSQGQILLGGHGFFELADGQRRGPLGTCEVVDDQSLPLPLRYLEWHYDQALDKEGVVSQIQLVRGVLKMSLAHRVRSLTLHFEAIHPPGTRGERKANTQNIDKASLKRYGGFVEARLPLRLPLNVTEVFQKPFSREDFWRDGTPVRPPPQVDWSLPGQLTLRTSAGSPPFNEVIFNVYTGLRLYSICYEIDHLEELTQTDQLVEDFVRLTWPGRSDGIVGAQGGGQPSGEETEDGSTGGQEPPWLPGPGGVFAPGVNPGLFYTPEGGIQPGFDYKLKIRTKHRRIRRSPDSTLDREYWALFRVPHPPSDLSPYVVATFPRQDGFPHHRASELYVRFNRNYIHKLMGNEHDRIVWELRRNGDPIASLPFRDDADADLSTFTTNTRADRKGWGWGKAPDHFLTREEIVWREAYNSTVPEGRQITNDMAIPDDMMWAYPCNPVLLREDFAHGLPGSSDAPSDEHGLSSTVADRWSITAARLHHEAAPQDATSGPDCFLLTNNQFPEPLMASVWFRPSEKKGRFALVFAAPQGGGQYLSRYLLVRFDLAGERLALIQKAAPDSEQVVKREIRFALSMNKWSRIRVRVTAGAGKVRATIDMGGETVLSSDSDLDSVGGRIGLMASADAVGDFDDLEVLSLSRLAELPSPGDRHELALRYTGAGHQQDMYKFPFVASRYLDLRDQLSAWDRAVWRSPQAEESAQAEGGWTAEDTAVLVGNTDPPSGWTGADGALLTALAQLAQFERDYQLGFATLTDLDDAKRRLRDVRFELDEAFSDVARRLGFSLTPQPQQIEFSVSKSGRGLLLEVPEPIDWTRLLAGPIQRLSAPGTIPIPTRIIYSSDFTRTILLLSPSSGSARFVNGGTYLWTIYQSVTLPQHLSWLQGWATDRQESHVLTLEMPSA